MKKYILYNGTILTGQDFRKGVIIIKGENIDSIFYENKEGRIETEKDSLRSFDFVTEYVESHPECIKIDMNGKTAMAGGIDMHVHFREPGMTHKGDFETESRAALLGGVTTIFDMPNTNPPTINKKRLMEKITLAEGRMHCNYGFHIGATNDVTTLEKEYPWLWDEKENITNRKDTSDFGAVKIFMGSSTGNMLVDEIRALDKLFSIKAKPILIHSEDEEIIKANLKAAKLNATMQHETILDRATQNATKEKNIVEQEDTNNSTVSDIPFSEHCNIRSREACIKCTAKALELAIKHGSKLHILHVSTAEETEMIRVAKQYNPNITAETSANYLTFCNEDYDTMLGKVKCNPAIKTAKDRQALRNAFKDGIIDTIGSDHAPHLLSEKNHPYLTCPSGLPTIQQSLSAMLKIADEENIDLRQIAKAFSEKPADILGLKNRGKLEIGRKADILILDIKKEFICKNPSYKCGWSPYEGHTLKGEIDTIFLNGEIDTDSSIGQKIVL